MIVGFTEALKTALASYTGKTITRAYIVSSKPSEVVNGRWFVMSAGENVVKNGHCDQYDLEVYLVYQRSLPNAVNGEPLLNNTFLDACMAEVQAMVNLFRNADDAKTADAHTGKFSGCGDYNSIGGFGFSSYTLNPLFDPVILRDNHIFSSVIRLTYRG